MNLLFVCSRNKIRSVTAERLYANNSGIFVRSAGTASSARHRINETDILWADTVFVFEQHHKKQLTTRFGSLLQNRQLIVLDIPDEYTFMQPELIEEIEARVDAYIF